MYYWRKYFLYLSVALYASVFAENCDAAFSNYRLWDSIGFLMAFGYSASLCTESKLIIVTCVLLLGMCGYFIAEAMERKKRKGRQGDRVNAKPSTSHVDRKAGDFP